LAIFLELGIKLKKVVYSVTLLPLQQTPKTGLLPVYVLSDRNCVHLRKSSFLVATIGVNFFRENLVIFIKCIDILE
jgi:hypothetical protein